MLARTQEAPKLGGQSGTIGGSNVAAILGKSPWAGPFDVWETAVFGRNDITSEAIERGSRLEPIVAELFKRRHPKLVCMEPSVETILHPSDDRFTASIDLEAWHQEGTIAGLVELKTANKKADWWNAPPEYYQYQLQHYLWIRGVKAGWLCCFQASEEVFRMVDNIEDAEKAIDRKSARFFSHKVIADPNYETEVVPKLIEFYENHIATKTPPPVDSSDGCSRVLKRLYPEHQGYVEMTEKVLKAARSRAYWATTIKAAKANKTEAENIIRSELKGRESAVNPEAMNLFRHAETDEDIKQAMKAIEYSVRISEHQDRIYVKGVE